MYQYSTTVQYEYCTYSTTCCSTCTVRTGITGTVVFEYSACVLYSNKVNNDILLTGLICTYMKMR